MSNQQESFTSWAIIELFGHQKIAGLVTESVIGGCNLIRVDVPAVGDQPAYTRYFGQGSIYSLTPVAEEIARSALDYIRPRPVQPYMLPQPKPAPDEDIPYSNYDGPDGDCDGDCDGDEEGSNEEW